MKEDFKFICFLSNQWSKCQILGWPMDTKWVKKNNRGWELTNSEIESIGRFDKIWKEYESRYNAHRIERERG